MYHNLQSVNVQRFITIKKTYLQTEHQKKKKKNMDTCLGKCYILQVVGSIEFLF